MSYHIYNTDAWIFGGTDAGEANRYMEIFTRDLGFLRVYVQGVRYLKSKQRYNLQNFSSAKVSLVRGKEIWRLTSASVVVSARELLDDKEKFMVVARVFSLFRRLVKGEEKDEELYEELDRSIRFLLKNNFDAESLKNLETVLVLRILSRLGYISADKDLDGRLLLSNWDIPSITFCSELRQRIVAQINLALASSQL